MKIATEDQHRCLAFIDACNRSGFFPTSDEVQLWIANPAPRGVTARSKLAMFGSHNIARAFLGGLYEVEDAEDRIDHLTRLQWVRREPNGGLNLTALGRALLVAAERSDEEAEDSLVVLLGRDDPLAYPRLIGHLASIGPALLVDPYFKIEQLMPLLTGTEIDRILVSKQYAKSKETRAALAVALTSTTLPRPIEVRATTDDSVHDRLVITATSVETIGASLNAIAASTVTTVITPVPGSAADAVRAVAEGWWAEAEIVGPPPADDTAASPDSGSGDEKPEPKPRKRAAKPARPSRTSTSKTANSE